jgi:lysyl-tRNA synthetase class 2
MTQTTTANFLKTIRQYFWDKNFTEIEISYLNESLPLEPNIYSFKTNWVHKNQQFFLPTSPEFALKKFISENKTDCFAVSHCFRDLEDSNATHTPEFLMLEWYEINKNLNDLKISTNKFIKQFLPKIEFIELVLEKNDFDNESDFNQYFLNNIENNLPKDKAVFITGYPAFLSPLAQTKNEKNIFLERSERGQAYAPPEGSEYQEKCFLSDRFELYINGIEIANGCEENRDSKSIKKAFESEQKHRLQNNLPTHPYSNEFIKNCSKLPPCSGVAIGIDRLLSLI